MDNGKPAQNTTPQEPTTFFILLCKAPDCIICRNTGSARFFLEGETTKEEKERILHSCNAHRECLYIEKITAGEILGRLLYEQA